MRIDPERYMTVAPVSLDDHRDLQRRYEAKAARVEWQSGAIAMLHEEIRTVQAMLATMPAMQDTEILKRLAILEAEQALHEAEHTVQKPQETNLEAVHRLAYTLHPEWDRPNSIVEEA